MHRRTHTNLARLALGASLTLGAFAVGTPLPGGSAAPIAAAAPVPATSTVVYDSIDDPLPGNVPSLGFQARSTDEVGDGVRLAPGPRRLSSVTVAMSSWACETGSGTSCVTTPGATFTHPLTLNIYQRDPVTGEETGAPIVTATETKTIPYRPSADPTCPNGGTAWKNSAGSCFNGLATPVTFEFPSLPMVPGDLVWSIAYNTTTHGAAPIGAAPCGPTCPYDSLNVGLSQQASVAIGTDLETDGFLQDSTWNGAYCAGNQTPLDDFRLDRSCWTSYRPMARIETIAASEDEATVVVDPSSADWAFIAEPGSGGTQTTPSGRFVAGPATPPLGAGSAQLSLAGTDSKEGQSLITAKLGGTRLDRLTELSYSTSQAAGIPTISLGFSVRYDGNPGGWQGRLVYEPYHTVGTVPAGWQRWDTLQGKWWATNGAGAPCLQASPCTWTQLLSAFPNAVINPTDPQLVLKIGSGLTTGFTGQVDHLTIGVDDGASNITTTNYDFEPTPPDCVTTGSTVVHRVSDFDDTVIRSSGRFEVIDGGAHVWTLDASSNAKVAGYVDAPGAKIGETFEVVWSGTTPAPGAQIVLSDGSILVGEAIYGNDLWVPETHAAAAYAPQTGGGFGSLKHGTPAEWQAAIEAQGVTVAQVGFSLGSGVLGDGVLTSVTAGCHTITFDEVPQCTTDCFVDDDGDDANGGTSPTDAKRTIQAGIDRVDTGGTVHVAAGLYEMASPVEIDKTVSLLGPNAGISPNRPDKPTFSNPARQAEATLAPAGGNQLIRIGAPGVVVDGFRFTDPATAGSSNVTLIGAGGNFGGQADGVEIANNVFWRISRIAVYTNGPTLMSGVEVHDNRVAGPTRADGCGTGAVADSACGHQLFNLWQAEDVEFVDNVVLAAHANGDRARVLSLNAPTTFDASDLRVEGNTIRNACVFTCFSIAAGVDDVRITGNDVDIDSGDIVGIHGTFTGGDVMIDHNVLVVDEGSSVKVEPAATNVSGVDARRNSMVGGGVTNTTSVTIDATCNWWGRSSGPRSGQNAGKVDASKHLTSDDLDGTCKQPSKPEPPKPPKPVTPKPTKPSKPEAPKPSKPAKADFQPITPTRLFDTRPGAARGLVSVTRTQVTPQRQLAVEVTGLPGGLVPSTGVGAVSLNVTVDAPTDAGWLAVVPCGSSKVTSSVNFDVGETTANAVLVAVPSNGEVCFRASTALHLVVDITGWLPSGGDFHAVTPERVFDTRTSAPEGLRTVPRRQVTPQHPLSVKLTDLPGGVVPAGGVGAVSLNVTIADAPQGGWLAVAPCGTPTLTSSVNFRAGANRANAVLTPVGPDGRVCFTSNVPVHVIVDVNGWFGSTGDFRAVTPDRLFDTRPGTPDGLRSVTRGQVAAMQPLAVKVTGLPRGVVPASGVEAVSLNVTVADAADGGWVSVAPCGSTNVTSNVNFRAATNTANAVLVAVPDDGRVCFTSSVAAHLVVDINGWFAG